MHLAGGKVSVQRMIQTVVNMLRELEATTGIRLVTTELEILSVLYHEGPMSVQTLLGKVRASSSGFHLIKKSMQDTGLIAGCRSPHDARVKLIDLAPALRESLAVGSIDGSFTAISNAKRTYCGARSGDHLIGQHA